MGPSSELNRLNSTEIGTSGSGKQVGSEWFARRFPTPITLVQTGLSIPLLRDLTLKHLLSVSVASLGTLGQRMRLSGAVIEELAAMLRDAALIEVSSQSSGDGTLAFRLTTRGRESALDALGRSGYVGPAPVPLDLYREAVDTMTRVNKPVTREKVLEQFADFPIDTSLLDQLGAAFNAHRAVFIYGEAGTGKTFTLRQMGRLFEDFCLVPHAIAVEDSVVQVLDPQIHVPAEGDWDRPTLRYADGFDRRFVPCNRPMVTVGGELTLDLLEVRFDRRQQLHQAPLQLKANNGILFIDDIGRQAVAPQAVFNRWIIPMEERRDYLALANGLHFEMPFDVQLVFSSNLDPSKLADEASLRRIGFKIRFQPVSKEIYSRIWRQELALRDLVFREEVLMHVLEELHGRRGVPLLPCHPRDLIGMALTQAIYLEEPRDLTIERLEWAWSNYFVAGSTIPASGAVSGISSPGLGRR